MSPATPPLFTSHLPLPPPFRLDTQTNHSAMKFKRLSTACQGWNYVGDTMAKATLRKAPL
jgi:hypothetical protein